MTGTEWPEPGTARAEAERLVATGLAALSLAADRIGAPTRERGGAAAAGYDALGEMLFGPSGHRGHTIADGSLACRQCPLCRAIAAARNPDPALAERLATGVGNLAEQTARVLRGVAGAWSPPAGPAPEPAAADPAGQDQAAGPDLAAGDPAGPAASGEPDDPWAAATAAGQPRPEPEPE